MDLLHKNTDNHPATKPQLTFAQKTADKVSGFVGSWSFIIYMTVLLIIWILINSLMIIYKWDVYPFILLNLILSCLAAYQAPLILMSQNRAAERDRAMAKYDYQVNRKAEREIQSILKGIESINKKLGQKKKK